MKEISFPFLAIFLFSVTSATLRGFTAYTYEREALHELWLRNNLKDPFFDCSPLPEDLLALSLSESEDPVGNMILGRFEYLHRKKVKLLNLSSLVSSQYDTVWDIAFFPRASLRFSGMNLLWEPVLRSGNDSLYPRFRREAVMRLDFDRAYLSFERKGLYLLLGRERVIWGGSPLSPMTFSGTSPAFDMLFVSYRRRVAPLGTFHAQYGATQLDDFSQDGETIRRYLVFHRLDFSTGRLLRLGFSEVTLFGGKERSFDFLYMNPWIIYYPYQWNRGKITSDNYLWVFDGRLTLGKKSLYGALLLDDIQLVPDGEPPHLGLSTVFEGADIFSTRGTYFLLSYQAMTRWAMTYSYKWERFNFMGYPLSHPLTPDFDQLEAFFSWHLSPERDYLLQLELTREGEGDMFADWPEDGFPKENFLSGVVQKSVSLKTGIRLFRYSSSRSWSFHLWIGGISIENYLHREGNKRNSLFIETMLRVTL